MLQSTSKFVCMEIDPSMDTTWLELPPQHTLILQSSTTLPESSKSSQTTSAPMILNVSETIDWWMKLLSFLQIFPSYDLGL